MIQWRLLGAAIDWYVAHGYQYAEVPWATRLEALQVTCPPDRTPYPFGDLGLVGSAEQSFIAMHMDGQLPPGRYVACTPCFRVDEIDDLHDHWFMKVELYQNSRIDGLAFEDMLADAYGFHRSLTDAPNLHYDCGDMNLGKDLLLNGIEIGSYGVRTHGLMKWIYGTGLALPRFSIANSHKGNR